MLPRDRNNALPVNQNDFFLCAISIFKDFTEPRGLKAYINNNKQIQVVRMSPNSGEADGGIFKLTSTIPSYGEGVGWGGWG